MVSQLIEDNRSASEAAIQIVSEELDVEPIDLSPLYSVVDGDALDKVFASVEEASVEFVWNDCRVHLTQNSDANLEVEATKVVEMATE